MPPLQLPRLMVLLAAALLVPASRAAELWRRPSGLSVAGAVPQSDEAVDTVAAPAQSADAEQVSQALSRTSAALAQQFLRSSRAVAGMHQQPYDVPLIGE